MTDTKLDLTPLPATAGMTLFKSTEKIWYVALDGQDQPMATIYLDPWKQVGDVSWMRLDVPNIDAKIVEVKRLVLSHAGQYARVRHGGGMVPLPIRDIRNKLLTEEDSDRLMSWDEIPEKVRVLDAVAVGNLFDEMTYEFRLGAVEAAFPSVIDVFTHVIAKFEAEKIFIGYDCRPLGYSEEMLFNVCLLGAPMGKEPEAPPPELHFRIWHNLHDSYDGDLENANHIVPEYHPQHPIQGRRYPTFLLNGATDCIIRGDEGFKYMSPGKGTRFQPGTKPDIISGSWAYIDHPYYAEMTSMNLRVHYPTAVTAASAETLEKLIRAALNQQGMHIASSGGFTPPGRYRYPQQPKGHREVRGSENACAWQYQTLKDEGQLDGALVPKWFLREGWGTHYKVASKETEKAEQERQGGTNRMSPWGYDGFAQLPSVGRNRRRP